MEGNFEISGGSSGGSGSGPSMSGSGDLGEIYSSGELVEFGPGNSTGSNMSHLDYLKDGVNKGYYKQDTEGIFSMEEVMGEAQDELRRDDQESEWDVMNIPGTAHEKLESLADMSDEELEGQEEAEEKIIDSDKEQVENEEFEAEPSDKLTYEQEIIKIQAETMRLMAEAMNSNVNKKELEELLKKLKELAKEADKDKGGNRASILTGLFSAVLILMEASEKGYKMVENEVKEAEKA